MNPPHREEPKTVVPLKISGYIGIPLDQSLEWPNLYWQYVPQSGTQSTPPGKSKKAENQKKSESSEKQETNNS